MNLSADLRRYDFCLFCSKIFTKPPTIHTANLQRIIAGALRLGRRCVSLLLIQTHKVYRLCTDCVQISIVSHGGCIQLPALSTPKGHIGLRRFC